MKIKTDRLLIIPCTAESYNAYSDKYKMGSHIEMHLEELKNDIESKGWGVWFVIHSDSNLVIGDVGFKGKPNDQKVVEIGYGINSDYQNNGFATEAVNGIKGWAFDSNQVEKIGMSRTCSKNEFIYWETPQGVKS